MLTVRDYSISKKLTWMNMLVSGTALLLACTAFFAYDLYTAGVGILHNLHAQAAVIGSNTVSALVFNDPRAAQDTLSALKASPHIVYAAIYTADRQPFASYSNGGSGKPLPLPEIPAGKSQAWFPNGQVALVDSVVFQGRPTGFVYLRSDLGEISERLKSYAVITATVMLLSLIVALLISRISQRVVSRPVVELAETARTISREKNYGIRAAATGNHDEVSTLIESFNEMVENIQERDTALRQARDELERRVAERTAQLADANLELAHANRELQEFSAAVAHDLRAPLRTISGYCSIIAKRFSGELNADALELLSAAIKDALEMNRLIDDLLNLSRVGRQELALSRTSLTQLARASVDELSAELRDRQIEWRIAELPTVNCDPRLMKQVFVNLISNAAKYTRPREQAVIEVGSVDSREGTAIFVRDNGVGFNMAHAKKLFTPFHRLHGRGEFEGTGVGLATVHRIIEKHGGKIWAEAEEGRGATFLFTLDIKKVKKGAKAKAT